MYINRTNTVRPVCIWLFNSCFKTTGWSNGIMFVYTGVSVHCALIHLLSVSGSIASLVPDDCSGTPRGRCSISMAVCVCVWVNCGRGLYKPLWVSCCRGNERINTTLGLSVTENESGLGVEYHAVIWLPYYTKRIKKCVTTTRFLCRQVLSV